MISESVIGRLVISDWLNGKWKMENGKQKIEIRKSKLEIGKIVIPNLIQALIFATLRLCVKNKELKLENG